MDVGYTVREKSTVDMALGELDTAAKSLLQDLEGLATLLMSVMTPKGVLTTTESTAVNPVTMRCRVVDELSAVVKTVNDCKVLVGDIKSRLEV